MDDRIIQVSGFGVSNTNDTKCDYMVVGVTVGGRVVITTGDGMWADISPKAIKPDPKNKLKRK